MTHDPAPSAARPALQAAAIEAFVNAAKLIGATIGADEMTRVKAVLKEHRILDQEVALATNFATMWAGFMHMAFEVPVAALTAIFRAVAIATFDESDEFDLEPHLVAVLSDEEMDAALRWGMVLHNLTVLVAARSQADKTCDEYDETAAAAAGSAWLGLVVSQIEQQIPGLADAIIKATPIEQA